MKLNKTKFPYRISISLTTKQGEYLEGKVCSLKYDSIAQVIRDLINKDFDAMEKVS